MRKRAETNLRLAGELERLKVEWNWGKYTYVKHDPWVACGLIRAINGKGEHCYRCCRLTPSGCTTVLIAKIPQF
jgi:hypothetical protein